MVRVETFVLMKGLEPIVSTPSLIVRLSKEEQLRKVQSAIFFTPPGMIISFISLQSQNIPMPISDRVAGSEMSFKLKQAANAPSPNETSFFGRCTSLRLSHSLKAWKPMVVTPSGMVIVHNEGQQRKACLPMDCMFS